MGFLKKTVLLTNRNKGVTYGMAVLTIEKNNGGVFASLTSYDFGGDNLLLGISVDGKEVIKQNVLFGSNHVYNFKLPNTFEINGNIAGVLVQITNGNIVPLAWGSNNKKADLKQNIINNIEEDYFKPSNQIYSSVTYVQGERDTVLNNQTDFKEQLFESTDEEIEQIIDNELDDKYGDVDDDFYRLIKSQLDDLFESYPSEDNLTKIIPNSKWVRVDYENNGKEYVVGEIYDDDHVRYICYGVPGSYDTQPPANIAKYSQWLPIDLTNPEGLGYWIMYQDAATGDSVEVS